ncbi:MAG: hypothetical protein PGN20_10895 [Agrobacterium cavarae]
MAERIIDPLKVVDVDHHNGIAIANGLWKPRTERVPVRHARQNVKPDQTSQPLFGSFFHECHDEERNGEMANDGGEKCVSCNVHRFQRKGDPDRYEQCKNSGDEDRHRQGLSNGERLCKVVGTNRKCRGEKQGCGRSLERDRSAMWQIVEACGDYQQADDDRQSQNQPFTISLPLPADAAHANPEDGVSDKACKHSRHCENISARLHKRSSPNKDRCQRNKKEAHRQKAKTNAFAGLRANVDEAKAGNDKGKLVENEDSWKI